MSWSLHQVRTVGWRCGEKFVTDDVELLAWPPGAEGLEEAEELAVAFAVPDPVEDLAAGQQITRPSAGGWS
jgi:hypothetical protein